MSKLKTWILLSIIRSTLSFAGQGEALFESKDWQGRTPLMVASATGNTAMVKKLLDDGANIEAKDHLDGTALMWAAKGGHTETVKALLMHGANLEAKHYMAGYNAFMFAAANMHSDTFKLLHSHKALIDTKDNNSWTILMTAAYYGHKTVADLLSLGADFNIKNNHGLTALRYAMLNNYAHIVRLIREHSINYQRRLNEDDLRLLEQCRFGSIADYDREYHAMGKLITTTIEQLTGIYQGPMGVISGYLQKDRDKI